VRNHQK
jgi:hypothetical protein